MRWLKKNGLTVILLVILLAGLGLLLYPSFSDYWNSFHQSRAIASYAESVADMSREKYDEIIARAEAYNRELSKSGIKWILDDEEKKNYNQQLAISDSSVMGYIDIPKIDIKLPIYHGTDESVLQIAIGHLEGTSLPVGGEGSHCVMSGHRGLPSAKLFSDLDKITEGDTFSMTVMNRTLTYEVDQIRVVEPSDLSDLKIEQGKDYCTLVTCTPYGINTHRLLVRGHRTENPNGDAEIIADALQIEPIYIAPFLAVPVLLLLILGVLVVTGRQRSAARRKRRTFEKAGFMPDGHDMIRKEPDMQGSHDITDGHK